MSFFYDLRPNTFGKFVKMKNYLNNHMNNLSKNVHLLVIVFNQKIENNFLKPEFLLYTLLILLRQI